MFNLLETKIMNQYVVEKWEGYTIDNSDIMDHSTACTVMFNTFGDMINENVF